MANNLITSTIAHTAQKASDSRDLEQQVIKTVSNNYYQNYLKELAALKTENGKTTSGTSDNKTVSTTITGNTATNATNKDLEKQVSSAVSDVVKNDATAQQAVNKLKDQVISASATTVANSVSSVNKTADEYYLSVKAALRAFRTTLNDNPQLESEVKQTVEKVVTQLVIDEESAVVGSAINKTGSAINSVANTARDQVTSIGNIVNSYNINRIIQTKAQTSINSIADTITKNDTINKLSNLPIVGTYFKGMSQTLNATIKTYGTKWTKDEMTKIATYTKSVTTIQSTTKKYQQEINNEITKAQNEAKQYMTKLENQIVNEIKKYIKLDNISIGSFKL